MDLVWEVVSICLESEADVVAAADDDLHMIVAAVLKRFGEI